MLTVNHRQGALLGCLQIFSNRGVNLTKLESRPVPEKPWEYRFYLDVEGHAAGDDLQTCFESLRSHTNHLKVLGTYCRSIHDGESIPQVAEPHVDLESDETELVGKAHPTPKAPKKNSSLKLAGSRDDGSRTIIRVGDVEFGSDDFVMIIGPCASTSLTMAMATAGTRTKTVRSVQRISSRRVYSFNPGSQQKSSRA